MPDDLGTGVPTHVAIIMDGNGRWAKKRFMNRINGHEKGADAVRMVVRTAREIGIQVLTMFAFSTENWQRPQTEIYALMTLLKKFLISEQKEMMDNNIRLQTIGQIERLPEKPIFENVTIENNDLLGIGVLGWCSATAAGDPTAR